MGITNEIKKAVVETMMYIVYTTRSNAFYIWPGKMMKIYESINSNDNNLPSEPAVFAVARHYLFAIANKFGFDIIRENNNKNRKIIVINVRKLREIPPMELRKILEEVVNNA